MVNPRLQNKKGLNTKIQAFEKSGGAGRDRTDNLLKCHSGALPTELQPLIREKPILGMKEKYQSPFCRNILLVCYRQIPV
jgi:hypothetical protein